MVFDLKWFDHNRVSGFPRSSIRRTVRRGLPWRVFLTALGLSERGPDDGDRAPYLWRGSCPHGLPRWIILPLGLPIATVAATPEELPSPRRCDPGGTSAFRRVDLPFRLSLIDRCYQPGHRGRVGRRGTFTGQCCQPLCAGDIAKHLSDPSTVAVLRSRKNPFQSFSSIRNLAHHSRPKRDPSRTILTWPLRRHSLPSDAGCIAPPPLRPATARLHWLWRVRVRISERLRTRPGRIRFHPVPSF
jgi:hypothetical protein